MERAITAVNRAASSNTVVNVFLLSVFGALSARSLKHQWDIEALEAEKNALLKSNKEMRKTMWDWKQQLYAEAEALSSRALVPLSKLKAIYGDQDTAASNPPPFRSADGNSEGSGKAPGNKRKKKWKKRATHLEALRGIREETESALNVLRALLPSKPVDSELKSSSANPSVPIAESKMKSKQSSSDPSSGPCSGWCCEE
nr:uncharacterized protein LOC109161747 isoform X1 [Ipomoea trifida]